MNKIYFATILFALLTASSHSETNESIVKEINRQFANTPEEEQPIKKEDVIVAPIITPPIAENKDSIKRADSIFAAQSAILNELEATDTQKIKMRMLMPGRQMPNKQLEKESEWQREYLITTTNTYKKEHVRDSNQHVFGWHPYWMGNSYESYNFSLLSSIAYFSYEMNPETGGYKTIHNWKTTAMVDSAKAHKCEVLLCVTNFGGDNNKTFLKNIAAQKNFINTVITLLKERDADGISLNFEGVPRSVKEEFTNFIIDLSSSLKTENRKYKLTITLPAIDFDNVYDIRNINAHIDLFVIMGYEYYGSNSYTAGPVSPLTSGNTWWPYNLERSVDEYMAFGISPDKLLLGISYYGAEWTTYDLKFPSRVKHFNSYFTYRSIKKKIGNNNCVIDEASLSKSFVYRDNANEYRQLWFDDSVTLAKKYDWIKSKKLKGVGIWALGYDNGSDELWKLIASKFAVPDKIAKAEAKKKSSFSFRRYLNYALSIMRNPTAFLTSPTRMLSIFGCLFGVGVVGLIIAFRYGHRMKRIFKIAIQGTIAIAIILIIALIFIMHKYMGMTELYFLIGGIIGGLLLFYLFTRRQLSEKELP